MDDIIVDTEPIKTDKGDGDAEAAARIKTRLDREKETIERMYCPCPGFAYNALAGEKNALVSFHTFINLGVELMGSASTYWLR
jgi:hypothetical protein